MNARTLACCASGAVADVVESFGGVVSGLFATSITGVDAPAETTPWNRIARRPKQPTRRCLPERLGSTRSRRASEDEYAGSVSGGENPRANGASLCDQWLPVALRAPSSRWTARSLGLPAARAAWFRLRLMMPPCSRPSRTLRAAPARGGLRPSLTAAVRDGLGECRSGRQDGRLDRTTGWLLRMRLASAVRFYWQQAVRRFGGQWRSYQYCCR